MLVCSGSPWSRLRHIAKVYWSSRPKDKLGNLRRYYWVVIVSLTQVPSDFDRKVWPPLIPHVSFVSSPVRLQSQIFQLDPLRTGLSPILPLPGFPKQLSLSRKRLTKWYRGWLGLVPVLIKPQISSSFYLLQEIIICFLNFQNFII